MNDIGADQQSDQLICCSLPKLYAVSSFSLYSKLKADSIYRKWSALCQLAINRHSISALILLNTDGDTPSRSGCEHSEDRFSLDS